MLIRLLGTTCVAVALLAIFNAPAGAQCGPCAPSVRSAMSGGDRYVYIDPAITGNARTDIESSFGAVGWALSGLRGMVDYVMTTDPGIAHVTVQSANLANGVGGVATSNGNGGGLVELNSAFLNSGNRPLIWNIATHEAMHISGFRDVTQGGCATTASSMVKPISSNGPFANGPTTADVCAADQTWGGNESPIIISLNVFRPRISSLDDGVLFDVRASGSLDLVAWPTDDRQGFLVLDRNGNGFIDSGAELFGNHTPLASGVTAENGYEALREFDLNGDEWIEDSDPVFRQLRLWIDRNRDGISQAAELVPLSRAGILGLSLRYETSRYVDRWGNEFRYRAPVIARPLRGAHESWDIFLRNRRSY